MCIKESNTPGLETEFVLMLVMNYWGTIRLALLGHNVKLVPEIACLCLVK